MPGQFVDRAVQGQKPLGLAAAVALEQLGLKRRAGRPHADECGLGAAHQAVSQEPVLPGDQDLVGKACLDQPGDVLKRHHAVERGDLDPQHVGSGQKVGQDLVRVANAACRLVEVEEDQGQAGLGDGGMVVQDQSVAIGPVAKGGGRMNEHGIGAQVAGLTGHASSRLDHLAGISQVRRRTGGGDDQAGRSDEVLASTRSTRPRTSSARRRPRPVWAHTATPSTGWAAIHSAYRSWADPTTAPS